jgi:subtilisin family serine protease
MTCRRLALIGSLLLLLAPPALAAFTPDGSLAYLSSLRESLLANPEQAAALTAETPERQSALAPRIAMAESFRASLRFVAAPTGADFERMRALGLRFVEGKDGPLGSRSVFAVTVPWSALPRLYEDPALARLEAAWRPGSPPPLAQSRPQIETEIAWQVEDGGGAPLSGAGVTICDIDTGVWYYQHNFFRLSGEIFDWLDEDGSGGLSLGDAVDLDDNGLAGPDESLTFLEAGGVSQYGNGGGFDADFDWLYNDADTDGQRDYGSPAYGENDPCYGERLFLVDDTNANGQLDPGESLLALGASKIRAIYNQDGSIYSRGVDLLQSETDGWGHGTQVSGIFGGGWAGRHAMTGIAPGVESLHVDYQFASEPPFLLPIEAGLAWAVAEGADVVLIEDGEWVWEFMDGSSNLEIMMNELAADEGVIFIVPAGNLATGNMHGEFDGNDVVLNAVGSSVVWPSFLWRDSVKPQLTLTPPGGSPFVVPDDGVDIVEQGYEIHGLIAISDRGTRRWDLRIARQGGGSLTGAWSFHFSLPLEMHAYFGDNVSGWYSSSSWDAGSMQHTVTWPATADSAISVAAYNPAGDGDINSFSGWGPRIDGRPDVDIAAPGSTVYSCSPWGLGQYGAFGGTSSAGPHVAGAAALLRQLIPGLDNGLCRALLRAGAGEDGYTGDTDRWGSGKLRIAAAIAAAINTVAEAPTPSPLRLAASPNPFNPSTTLSFDLPGEGEAELRIFTVDGRQVWGRKLRGDKRSVTWDGRDASGRRLASGVYLVHLRQENHVAAVRLTLLK